MDEINNTIKRVSSIQSLYNNLSAEFDEVIAKNINNAEVLERERKRLLEEHCKLLTRLI